MHHAEAMPLAILMTNAFGRPPTNGIDDVGLVDHLDLKTGGNPRNVMLSWIENCLICCTQ